ncbi:MAG: glycosyltransferase [Candidatus Dadabacteria bacterium]|nr:MAG: glycosyltransferase [Candidatus Dadabacteria bacterium]
MPRIAFVIHAWTPADAFGGPISKVRRLIPGLRANGFEPEIWTTTLSAPSTADLAAGESELDGVRVRRLPTLYARRWSALVRIPRDLPDPNGLHILGAWTGLSYQAMLHARQRGLAVAWEPCGMLVESGRHQGLKRMMRPLHRWMARHAVVSWTSRREAQEAAVRPSRYWLRPNPIPAPPSNLPTRAQARSELGLPATGPIVGYLGRIAARKGIRRVLAQWPGPTCGTLLFTGPVEDLGLAQQIDAAGSGVLRTPPLPAEAVPIWMRAVDCLVLTPDYGENFGNVVAEAVAVGTPAIVSEAVGAAEWLNGAGVVVVRNDQELARALRTPEAWPPAHLPDELRAEAVGARLAAQWRDLLAARHGGSNR